jgi:type I restriction enzyme M protein
MIKNTNNTQQFNQLVSFIWNIANDVLVHAFNKGDYKKIILPMMVLRRLDILLEPTKDAVLKQKQLLDRQKITNQSPVLMAVTKYPFYNTSQFTMKTLTSETNPQRLKMNFLEYLDGYSRDVQDVIEKFKLKQQVDNLTENNRLGSILDKFTNASINLGINPVKDKDGQTTMPGVDNHTMGTVFEELLRRFNEENSVTEAGEHFTPRDYVQLLSDLAVLPVADKIESNSYSIYDGACGTGGILTIAKEQIQYIAEQKHKSVQIHTFGQELQPDTYATSKADIMISGQVKSFSYTLNNQQRDYIAFGSTISQDGHRGETFDFCISNPPFGTPWKEDLKNWGLGDKEKDKITYARFVVPSPRKGEEPVSFIPAIDDTQMLFLANNVSRMKDDTPLGTRIVEVHNGSSLFTGNAGGGASNLRQYIIENDLLEAIIAMPEKDFYNTGIGTFIWVITNRKEPRRQGKVQLIDATAIKTPLRKNLGEKNCETNADDRRRILELLMKFEENSQSRIFPNKEFGYWEITVMRPLRLRIVADADISSLKPSEQEKCWEALAKVPADTPLDDWNRYDAALKLPAALKKKLRSLITVKDEKAVAVEGEADHDLTDTEQVPLLYEGGIAAFMQNEVLPYIPDAYIDHSKTRTGYELSFTKYFYRPASLRSLDEIKADLTQIQARAEELRKQIMEEKA